MASGGVGRRHDASPTDAREIVETYFGALRTGELSSVPYTEDTVFRAPLSAGGSAEPITGREAILEFLGGIVPRISNVEVRAILTDGEWAAGSAVLTLSTPPGAVLRTMNLFRIRAGRIVEQENHFDPRPALGQL